MPIVIKLKKLLNDAIPALRKLSEAKCKGKVRLRLTRLLRSAMIEEEIWTDARNKMIDTYEYTNENGDPAVPKESLSEFKTQLEEALNEEVELNVGPLKISLLKNTEIEPLFLAQLGPLLEDDEDPDEEPKEGEASDNESDDE
jgi:hypothetical protein